MAQPPLAEVAMYSECASLTEVIQERVLPRVVLNSYPAAVGRDVVCSVLAPLTRGLAGREKEGEEACPALQTREEVEWTMEVVGYGLQLTDSDLVSSCINVYEDWLTSFSATPSSSVPPPVAADPNHYCQIIFSHLYQLFLPRDNGQGGLESLSPGQPGACQRALAITQSLLMKARESLSESTCEAICCHLLSVTDLILSPPPSPGPSLAANLSNQLVHTLFITWLHSCTASFPAPHLWRTLRELCVRCRHHPCLAQQWSSLMFSLTLRVVRLLYSTSYLANLRNNLQEDPDFSELLHSIPEDSLVQCWFRMLHTLSNPVDLSHLSSFSSLPLFQKMAGETGQPVSVSGLGLPLIFHQALHGVARMVYLFLALDHTHELLRPPSEGPPLLSSLQSKSSPGGVLRRKGSREYSHGSNVATGSGGGRKKPTWYVDVPSPRLPPPPMSRPTPLTQPHLSDTKRPRGNTLLHLFGSWLFEAASRPLSESGGERRRSESSKATVFYSLLDLNSSIDSTLTTPTEDHAQFEAGQAEAFGALCAIFSSQPCEEPFLPLYLARFYHCLRLGLQHNEASQGLVLTRILLNSPSLFRKGLPGINLLLPHFLAALDQVLPHPTPQVRCAVSTQELRHASIQLLLSVFSLPLHFLSQPLPAMPEAGEGEREEGTTFYSLREWMVWLLFSAIGHERDVANLQLLLHGVLVSLQDTVLYENVVTRLAEEGDTSSPSSQRTNFFSSIDKDYSSANLFRRACKAAHWCLLTWQGSIHVSLSALELLQGLATLQFEYIDHADLNMAVMWVCDYIHHRAEKDKLLHSKDLHTSIVAAFSCLLSWVTLHPYLLGDKATLDAVIQVVELGISGTFSVTPSGQKVYKGEKELRPISGRVKDIAEFALTAIMEQVGAFPQPCGAESTASFLNEEHLLASLPVPESQGPAHPYFKYFLLDNTIVLGLLEAKFTRDAAPSVMAVARGLSGRHCWHMQLRMRPRSSQAPPPASHSMPRPEPSSPPVQSPSSLQRTAWPEEACDGPQLELDGSLPSLDSVLNEGGLRDEYERMAAWVCQEIELESFEKADSLLSPSVSLEPPYRMGESIDTSRLLLSHLSFLGLETLQPAQTGQKRSLVILDQENPAFKQALGGLDRLHSRFCNTVFVLHCREGSNKPEEILAQQGPPTARPQEFTEFLQGLGWSVDPVGHAGFSGKLRPEKAEDSSRLLQFGAQIPHTSFFYYSDSMTEMAFVQPLLSPSASHSSASLRSVESSDSGQDAVSTISKSSLPPPPLAVPSVTEREPLSSQTSLPVLHQTPAGDGERFNTLPSRGKPASGSRTDLHSSSDIPRKKPAIPQDCAALVVWLERYEDHTSFPLEALSSVLHGASLVGGTRGAAHQRRILPCIFIHRLPSGLYQVTTAASRMESLAGPLQEGMVVSRRALSRLVRLTAANMCGRHRLENEGYCPPHVKRKRKMEEIAANFSLPTPVPEFYSRLLFPDQTVPRQ